MWLTCLSHEGNLDFSLLRVGYDLGFQQVNCLLKYHAGSAKWFIILWIFFLHS